VSGFGGVGTGGVSGFGGVGIGGVGIGGVGIGGVLGLGGLSVTTVPPPSLKRKKIQRVLRFNFKILGKQL
jgi:hypothetical protein